MFLKHNKKRINGCAVLDNFNQTYFKQKLPSIDRIVTARANMFKDVPANHQLFLNYMLIVQPNNFTHMHFDEGSAPIQVVLRSYKEFIFVDPKQKRYLREDVHSADELYDFATYGRFEVGDVFVIPPSFGHMVVTGDESPSFIILSLLIPSHATIRYSERSQILY